MVRKNQLKPTLSLQLSQRLTMTPSLLQKIELLTLNQLELSDLLTQKLAENPILEEMATSEGEVAEKTQKTEKDSEQEEENYEDFDYEYFFGEYLNPEPSRREWESDGNWPSLEVFLAHPSSLNDHLNWQLNLCEIPKEVYDIAYYIIGNINEDGYLTTTLDEIAETLEAPVEKVKKALKVVQGMDPVGVGCRDLQECLLLQIRAAGLEGLLVEQLVKNYLSLLQMKKFKEVAKELHCELEDISQALETIRTYSPRPGQKYNSEKPVYIQPDVYIYKVGDDYQIGVNNDGLPRLKLNRTYRRLLKEGNVAKEAKSYIKERFRSAMELLKNIDQRQETIYRVCSVIMNRQRDFLERGLTYLKPMLIKDVAEELGVHSSTISRVVANKYAHSPQGIMELRKFFTVGVESARGENISVVYLKQKIKKIIDQEDSMNPLSDQKICKLLNQKGIQITRRTVSKYRYQLNILGSRERKLAFLF